MSFNPVLTYYSAKSWRFEHEPSVPEQMMATVVVFGGAGFLGRRLVSRLATQGRVLVPFAATGLALAVLTGTLLFSVRAQEYAAVGYLQAKLVLVLLGLLSASAIHRAYGLTLEEASERRLSFHALFSLGCWLGRLRHRLSLEHDELEEA
jgi:hypothetical protein